MELFEQKFRDFIKEDQGRLDAYKMKLDDFGGDFSEKGSLLNGVLIEYPGKEDWLGALGDYSFEEFKKKVGEFFNEGENEMMGELSKALEAMDPTSKTSDELFKEATLEMKEAFGKDGLTSEFGGDLTWEEFKSSELGEIEEDIRWNWDELIDIWGDTITPLTYAYIKEGIARDDFDGYFGFRNDISNLLARNEDIILGDLAHYISNSNI